MVLRDRGGVSIWADKRSPHCSQNVIVPYFPFSKVHKTTRCCHDLLLHTNIVNSTVMQVECRLSLLDVAISETVPNTVSESTVSNTELSEFFGAL